VTPGQPRSRLWLLRTRTAKVAAVAALCYLTAFAVVNLQSSPLGFVLDRLFPRVTDGNSFNLSSIADEWSRIEREYVLRDINGNVATQGAQNGIVQMLGQMFNDRFSAFLTKSEYDQLHQNLNGQRTGSIGIAIEGRCDSGTLCPSGQPATEVVIEDVLINQPAEQAGVRNGDVLIAVDGHSLSSLGSTVTQQLSKVSALVRGPAGTTVSLSVLRNGMTLNLAARRADLSIPSVYSRRFGQTLYVQVTGFDTGTGDSAKSMLRNGISGGATSVILDLRGNGGGFVTEAQTLASQFLTISPTEQDVSVRRGRMTASGGPASAQSVQHDAILPGGVAMSQPLAVLVDGDTASAAEIVSAALHDYSRATLVGAKTFGKGSVQLDFPLLDGSDLHLTVERWYGPNGETIDGSGIAPDQAVALSNPDSRFRLDAESADPTQDPQLQAALSRLAGSA
jgi:carboxyl-terminal processing protease